MKLLFDQNLSFKLVRAVAAAFPDSKHVRDFDLTRKDDESIWSFAGRNGFTIVSKDSDFMHRSLLLGHPPKVIHACIGNCSTGKIAERLVAREKLIKAFVAHPTEALLTIE